MQKSIVTTEDVGRHSKKSFIHRGTSGEDADNTGCSPSFSSLSTFLLLLSRVAIELRLVTILLDMNEMVHLQMRERGPIYSLRSSRGYSIATSSIRVLSILLHWIKPSYNQGWRMIEHVLLCMEACKWRWSH